MGCRHSQYYGEGEDARVESLRYKQRRSTKNKRSNRRKKAASVSSSSSQRKGSALSGEEQQHDGDVKRPSADSSQERDALPEEVEEGGFHSLAQADAVRPSGGKKGKKGKKGGKVKSWNKKREERRVQQLFGAGHHQTARDTLSLSLSSPAGDPVSPGAERALTSGHQSSDSLPARLLAHYKRAFPVWHAADYHFRQDGRGLTLSTLSGTGLVCQCGKSLEPVNGSSSGGSDHNNTNCRDNADPSLQKQLSSSSSTAAAVGTSGRQQCRRCSLAAAKRAGLLPSNNNGSLDGGSAAAAAADGDGDVGGGGTGDNGAAASGASPDPGKTRSNIDAIANFLVLVGVPVVVSVCSPCL